MKLAELKARLLANPDVAKAYDGTEEEFRLLEGLLRARAEAGLTQAEVARRMGSTQSAVARLEGGGISPSVDTLRRYAKAVGKRLRVEMV